MGRFPLNEVTEGDCGKLIADLPDNCIDVAVTSPPYWGQRISDGNGVEADTARLPRRAGRNFGSLLPRSCKPEGLLWLNVGDAYNTPVNWRTEDHSYSTLGPGRASLDPANSAYVKPRHRRKAFLDTGEPWLRYGNLLALPYRLVIAMCDAGWLFRGEVIWRKRNPMPEGKCRRPHRQHETIYLFAREEQHPFRTAPPVGSVWEFSNEKLPGLKHFSRFPEELPRRCIQAYGRLGEDSYRPRSIQRVRHDRRGGPPARLLVPRVRDRS